MPDLDIVARLKLAGEAFSSEFDARMKRVEDSAQSAASRANAALASISTAAKAAVAGIGAGALVELAQRGLEYASSLGEVSQQLGVTTKDLQVYRYAASQVGIEQETMDKALAKLTVTLGKAALGADGPAKAFQALGVNVRDTNGHVLTAGDAIPKIADGLARVTDPAQRAAAEVALFGKAGQQLDTLLSGGSAAVSEVATSAQRLGLVLSSEQIQHADDAADKISALKQVLEARIAGAVSDNADAILRFADAIGSLITKVPQGINMLQQFQQRVAVATSYAQIAGGYIVPSSAQRANGRSALEAAQFELTRLQNVGKTPFAQGSLDSLDRYLAANRATGGIDLPNFLAPSSKAAKLKATVDPFADLRKDTYSALGGFELPTVRGVNSQANRLFEQLQIDPEAEVRKAVSAAEANLGKGYAERLKEAGLSIEGSGEQAGRKFGESAGTSIREVAETLQAATGLRIGGGTSRALSVLSSGPAAANDNFGQGIEAAFAPIKGAFESVAADLHLTLGQGGSFEKSLGQLAGNAALGGIGGGLFSAIGGGKENKLASSLGGALGGEAGKALGKNLPGLIGDKLGKSLGGLAGPLGSIAGGVLGNVVSGLFTKVKYGTSSIGLSNGQLGAGSTTGNSSSAQAASSAAASTVGKGLQQIADQLGATIGGAPNLTIGTYKDSYRVSTTGYTGKLKKGKSGVVDFGQDEQAAVTFAIQQAVSGAVIKGISQASINILKSGQDLTAAVTKAGLIEAVPKGLKAALDPVGAAVDDLSRKFQKTVDALKEGGATSEQIAQAQQLYKLQMDQVKASTASASQSLKDFSSSLRIGSDSPYSLRDQEAQARAALSPYLEAIDAGSRVDQEKYQAAAKTFLDIERELYGSTQEYFSALEQIQAATNKAISTIDNAVPITGGVADPFASATANATSATADNTATGNELLSQISDTLLSTQQILASLAANGASSSDFIGDLRAFG